jgi:cobalamin biosynthesis protein CobT
METTETKMDYIDTSKLIGYEPYTQEFDRIEHIADVLSEERIADIYRRLTDFRGSDRHQIETFSQAVAVMGGEIAKTFEESGVDPAQTTVTLLIDNSGSTRGETAANMALGTIELCIALERLGVETSVLGYTTSSWKGGASRQKWIADGKPANPGRLCDIHHIIYKKPTDDVASVTDLLCALACDETKRENIDGEAVMWAADCLRTLDRPNKLLLNVTDGFMPIDDSTLISNSSATMLLLGHLLTVNNKIEAEGEIALAGVYVDLNESHLGAMTELKEKGQDIFPRSAVTHMDRNADATFCAMVDGLALGIRRVAELSPPQPAAARG